MYTDTLCQSIPWRSSKYPPPLKLLPPLPRTTYLTTPEPSSNECLLSHPVPSPFLRIDMMALYYDEVSSASSADSFTCSRESFRDSASSIIEFVQSLLPPTPLSVRPLTPANSVECRLQESSHGPDDNCSILRVTKRNATPNQLNKLCSELEQLQVTRRDSAMFDITQPKQLKHLRSYIEHIPDNHNQVLASPRAVPDDSGLPSPKPHRIHMSPRECSQPGQTSFIDWDDELPRLAKMKKSIADFKTVGRVRSNSAPMVPTRVLLASSRASSSSQVRSASAATDESIASQPLRKTNANNRSSSPTKLIRGKSARRRRTIFVINSARRLSQLSPRQTASPSPIGPKSSNRSVRIGTATSRKRGHRLHRLTKITNWVRKFLRCS